MKERYTPLITFAVIVVVLFVILVFVRLQRTPLATSDAYNEVSPSAELALDFNAHRHYVFSRDDCIHCQNLEAYLDQHEGSRAQLDLETANLSVPSTTSYFVEKAEGFAEMCGMNPSELGTPFLYINDDSVPLSERCIAGDTPIMTYFDGFLGISEAGLGSAPDLELEDLSLTQMSLIEDSQDQGLVSSGRQ